MFADTYLKNTIKEEFLPLQQTKYGTTQFLH
jgi:hypothetical protein